MRNRKNLPNTALPRIFLIDREIASGVFPNVGTLARKHECSESSIKRDIEYMRVMLGAPIEYDFQHRGYYYAEETFRLPAGFASAQDMLALAAAKSLLTLYRNTPLHNDAENLFTHLLPPVKGDKKEAWYEKRIVVPPMPSGVAPQKTWDAIMTALRENKIIEFNYSGIWRRRPERRRVHPYQLLFDGGVWYLYGYSEERKATRIFSLPRVKDIAVMKDGFELPDGFGYSAGGDDSYFGVFVGEHLENFAVACYGPSAVWVGDRQWASNQIIEENDEGLVIRFSSTQYDKVLSWVLSQGANARPLEPEHLVDDWRGAVRAMARWARD